MSPVNQNGQLDYLWAAQVDQSPEGGPYGAPRKYDVVYQDYNLPLNRERDLGRMHQGLVGKGCQVVPVKGDIQNTDRHIVPLDIHYSFSQALRQGHSPAPDADQHEVVGALVSLNYFVGYPGQGPPDPCLIQDLRFFLTHKPSRIKNAC